MRTAITVIVAQVIGVGIFLVPAGMAKSVGSPVVLLGIWIVTGLITLCGALVYSEFASRYPSAGGSYIYIREAFGKGTAFVYGWIVLMVLDPGLTAIFAVGFASYTGFLLPMSAIEKQLIAIGMILFFGVVSVLGTRFSDGFLKLLVGIKLGALAFVIIYGFGFGDGDIANITPFFAAPPDIFGALAGGFVGAYFAFAGWWEVTRIAGEMREPGRNLPRALVAGVFILLAVYVLTSFVFLYLVPISTVTNDEAFAALVGEALFGSVGGTLFAAIVAFSVIGTLFAYLIASPRVYFAMARDGTFFGYFGKLHHRFGTPYRATAIQVLLSISLVLLGSFNEILSYFFFVGVLFIGIAVAGIFRVHRIAFDGYRVPFYPATPIIFLVLTGVTLFFIAARNPLQTAVGVAVVLLGVPVYHLFFKSRANYGVDQDDQI